MAKMSPTKIKAALARTPEWSMQGSSIVRVYAFKDFPAAIAFVNRVAKLAEKAWHHPDIDIRWNKVRLSLTTHDQGGLTEKDFELAARCDKIVPS